jgi:hypothetical protein
MPHLPSETTKTASLARDASSFAGLLLSMLLGASATAARATPPADATMESKPAMTTTRDDLPELGISVERPSSANHLYEPQAKRYRVELAMDFSVGIDKAEVPAPKTLDEARRAWDSDAELVKLGEGVTAEGILWASRSFRVRIGFSDGTGKTVHTFKRVSRVYALLPLDEKSHLTCTGYLERAVESADDADLAQLRRICLSMRRLGTPPVGH